MAANQVRQAPVPGVQRNQEEQARQVLVGFSNRRRICLALPQLRIFRRNGK